jgi:hypothetical protein
MQGISNPTREQTRICAETSILEPGLYSLPGLLCQFEAESLLRLVLDHHGASDGMMSLHDFAYLQSNEIAAPQLAFDRQVEHCQLSYSVRDLQANPHAQISCNLKGGFGPTSLPLFQGSLLGRGVGL